jgi:hypothetical protein
MVKRVVVALAVVAVVVCGFAVAGSWPGRAASQESTSAVILRVRVGERVVGVVKVRSDDRASLTCPDGTRLALSPVLSEGQLQLAVQDTALSDQRDVLVFTLRPTEPVVIDAVRALSVEWLQTDAALPRHVMDDEPCQICCVMCDGFTLCACEVLMSCGHCCCKSACTCEFQGG